MLFSSRTICALAAAALISAPAFAQAPPATPPAAPSKAIASFDDLSTEQQDEVYCIYDAVGEDKDAASVEDWIVYAEKDAEAKSNAVFERAQTACGAKHKWNEDQTEVAFIIARAGVLADLAEQELRYEGFDDKKFEAMAGVISKMAEADFQMLLDMAYGRDVDDAFVTKMRGLLYETGVPKEDDIADLAIGLLGASLQERDAIAAWMENKFY